MRLLGKTPKPSQEPDAGLRPARSIARSDGRGETSQATSAEFDVGVASDCNQRYRKTMEDTHVVIVDFMGVPGCAYFAIFDGHAGSQCANAVGEHLHVLVANAIREQPSAKDIALALSSAFLQMDEQLRDMDIRHSGATAVVAVACYMNANNELVSPKEPDAVRKLFVANAGDSRAVLGVPHFGTSSSSVERAATPDSASDVTVADADQHPSLDARRLSYDHRCTDTNEQRRITNQGGLLINNRVNGMLAVTRSLGDLLMKDYVVGAPYTTESELSPSGHEVLVLACDGLWDVCSDEKAVQIAHEVLSEGGSPLAASEKLVAHALEEFSVDNLTVMVVSLN